MQTGKKKLVLDHLIVQKMDDEDSAGDDVQSVLTFGAKVGLIHLLVSSIWLIII